MKKGVVLHQNCASILTTEAEKAPWNIKLRYEKMNAILNNQQAGNVIANAQFAVVGGVQNINDVQANNADQQVGIDTLTS